MNVRLHRYVRNGLLAGVAPAFAFLAAGILLRLLRSETPLGHMPLREVFAGLLSADPCAFLSIGMLFLYFAPGLGAIAALVAFILDRDKQGILLTLAVLAIIAISINIRPQ